MGMLVFVLVSMVVTGVIMFVGGFAGTGNGFFISGFRGRFGGLLGLLFRDCQWITFRVLSMGKRKLLV